jgi:hypothetical protein
MSRLRIELVPDNVPGLFNVSDIRALLGPQARPTRLLRARFR